MDLRSMLVVALPAICIIAAPLAAKEIKHKDEFLKEVAGRKLVEAASWVIISTDGHVYGEVLNDRAKIEGRWHWRDGYYCREIKIGETAFPEDCQRVTVDGDTVSFIHKKGEGIAVPWTIE